MNNYFESFSYSPLNHLQVGRVCEYWVKMFLTLEGLDTYTSEVDDKGIDFVVRLDAGTFLDIQVKAIRLKTSGYVFISKKNWTQDDLSRTNLFLSLVLLKDGFAPDVYLIPASVWLQPNELFCSRDYGKNGQTSLPEWGVNISIKNMTLLEKYSLPIQVRKIKGVIKSSIVTSEHISTTPTV
jgi:hypothetical protein